MVIGEVTASSFFPSLFASRLACLATFLVFFSALAETDFAALATSSLTSDAFRPVAFAAWSAR